MEAERAIEWTINQIIKWIHPERLTWNPRMETWKMFFLFNWVFFRFHVNFQGCIDAPGIISCNFLRFLGVHLWDMMRIIGVDGMCCLFCPTWTTCVTVTNFLQVFVELLGVVHRDWVRMSRGGILGIAFLVE